MGHSQIGFQDFYPLDSYSFTRFPNLVRPLRLLPHGFLCRLCDLSMEYFDKHSFLVSTVGVKVSGFS